MHSQFQLVNPFREPSWRFQRVLDLVERDRPGRCTAKDDQFVKTYRRFAGKFRGAQTEEGRMALFPKYPGLFIAHLFHHQPDKEWRWLLQARILSRAGNVEIAALMATLPGAVDWYERIFFDVRDRLDARDYIVKQVIGKFADRSSSAREGKLTEFQEQVSYKLFGYFGGPLLLDIMFSGFLAVPIPDRPERVDQWLDAAMQTLIRRKATSAARHLEVNKYNIMQLMEVHMRIVEAAKESGGSASEYERNISAILENVPWELAELRAKRKTKEADKANVECDQTAVEPRANELVQLAVGRVPRKLLRDHKLRILPADVSEKETDK